MKLSGRRFASALVMGALLLSVSVLSLSTKSSAQIGIGIGISVHIGPPALPVYAQPLCPGPGYLWTPGYWAWNDDGGYYWVPGTWVVGPVGMLWTPGYWGFAGGLYGWHIGYWGPHVGFYGGINYGFGYGGVGFGGGEWRGGAFFYNRSVMNVNVTNVTNVYNKTVIVNNTHVAFNGPGGVEARPTAQEETYSHEQHTPAIAAQTEHEHAASQNKQLFASENHGRPAVAATAKPGEFSGRGVVSARAAGAPYHAPKMSPQQARASAQGNRAEPARNEPAARNESAARTDRPATATSNNREAARPNDARTNESRPTARPNEARSSEARTPARTPARNNEARTNTAPKAEPRSAAPKTAARNNDNASRGNTARPAARTEERSAPAAHAQKAPPAAKPAKAAPKPAAKPEGDKKKGR